MKKLIILICLILAGGASFCIAEDVYQDDGGTWHINTFPEDQHEVQNYLHVYTWVPEDDMKLVWAGGYADSRKCINDIEALNLKTKLNAIDWMIAARKTTNKEKIVAMSISVCHPEWVCIYIEGDNEKELFEQVIKEYETK